MSKLFPDFISNRERYDLVIPQLEIIVECHGEGHEREVAFGGCSKQERATSFIKTRIRDTEKEEIALENEWNYIVIWRKELPKDNDKAFKLIKDRVLETLSS